MIKAGCENNKILNWQSSFNVGYEEQWSCREIGICIYTWHGLAMSDFHKFLQWKRGHQH